ncbi:MAG: DEAD/DEAH box helicase family protein [Vulcanimicrobiota bacterium]
MECPFCVAQHALVFHRGQRILGLWSPEPQTPGHAVLIPQRHITDWFLTDRIEQQEFLTVLEIARRQILAVHPATGFDISILSHPSKHLQVQIIPQFTPNKLLSTGDYFDPFIRMLLPLLERARNIDIAVAFVQPSGLNILEPIFKTMLARQAFLRLVTGDTLGVTDPDALARLLDLVQSYPERAAVRIFQSERQSFHPKAYYIRDLDGSETAFIGSSNLTGSALNEGIEWNYRVVRNQAGLAEIRRAFENLFQHPKSLPLSHEWIQSYRERRNPPTVFGGASIAADITALEEREACQPHEIQQEALYALRCTRADGNRAGLVVLATGLGKTYLAAFDSAPFARVLFVAHRDEILNQARDTFRRVRPNDELGFYTGTEKQRHAPVLFASVQTLSRSQHLNSFTRDAFDYIIIDEFHHAEARTYRRLIEYFKPKFLLGLTATPDRTDGGDLLGLCLENLVYRCDLLEGIRRQRLSPFHYYGVPDTVDYQKVKRVGRQFDPQDLDAALIVVERAEHALEQYRRRAGKRCLVFCSSQKHCDFMDQFFRSKGLRSAAIHSGPTSAPRISCLEQLKDGELDLICSVDMFNEGLDLPAIDTVMMLRPTESPVLWLQQFGRGLRQSSGKEYLTVIDYIGNHRVFFSRPGLLLGKENQSNPALMRLLEELKSNVDFGLPEGCLVDFDLVAIELLEALIKREPKDVFLAWYQGFKELHGRRPSAIEALHQGYNPSAVRQRNGSWLGFLSAQQEFDQPTQAAYEQAHDFLSLLESTKLVDSSKMLILQAVLNLNALPGTTPCPSWRPK